MTNLLPTSRHARRGFTLVELMTVIAVIMILCTLFLGALWAAEGTARRAKTRALIAKLHSRIMSKYEEYQTRRLPIQPAQPGPGMSPYSGEFKLETARRKLYATRELMRMEMPDRYADLTFVPIALVNYDGTGAVPAYPFLWNSYRERILESQESRLGANAEIEQAIAAVQMDHQSAECLYLIVTYAVEDPSLATEQFSPKDFGDTDGDGMLEFIDAWGNPIWWMRWAPAFVSDLQPQFRIPSKPTADDNRVELFDSEFVNRMKDPNDENFFLVRDAVRYSDPFNPLKVDRWEPKTTPRPVGHSRDWKFSGFPEYGFNTAPLIISPGTDGQDGLNFAFTHEPVPHPRFRQIDEAYSDPYTYWKNAGGAERMRGEPLDGTYLDNVHNHMIQTR